MDYYNYLVKDLVKSNGTKLGWKEKWNSVIISLFICSPRFNMIIFSLLVEYEIFESIPILSMIFLSIEGGNVVVNYCLFLYFEHWFYYSFGIHECKKLWQYILTSITLNLSSFNMCSAYNIIFIHKYIILSNYFNEK